MINLRSVTCSILKLTQFCKEIEQQNLQSKMQLITSCQDCPYLVRTICPCENTKTRSSINSKNPLGWAFKKTRVFLTMLAGLHQVK